MGLHDDPAIMLESMNFPGFYLGVAASDAAAAAGHSDAAAYLTLTQPSAAVASGGSTAFCSGHQFMLRAGLDGSKGTVSLESVAHPGKPCGTPLPMNNPWRLQPSLGSQAIGTPPWRGHSRP